jgi:uncharacterized membrane protein YqhA
VKALLERSRYVLFIAVLALFAASLTALILGAARTVNTIVTLVTEANTMPHVTVSFIELMDIFLVAAVLYIFAIALYELFVEDLALPDWLVIHNLEELKAKLSGILVLVIVIEFAEHFIEWEHPEEMIVAGVGGAAIITALTLYNRYGAGH